MSLFRNILITSIGVVILHCHLGAQSVPQPLDPDIIVEHVITVPAHCSRLAVDPVSHDLFYLILNGDIHHVSISQPVITDELVYTINDHHIGFLQGMVYSDSLLFLVGDVIPDAAHTHGMVMRGKLNLDGSRTWDTVMYTALYPSGNTFFDHGFSGITISPDGTHLYVNSGARTDHGEEQDNGGLFPGTREVPLTSAIFEIDADETALFLPDDSAAIAPYLFCDGVRNSFDMAFSPDGDLFGCENSGDRDDPDELNWLRKDKHYGFPWILGGDFNPMQFTGYNPDSDVMLSKQRYAYVQGFYHDDPLFPPLPAGLITIPAIQNFGPDADYYRDSLDAQVKDASVTGHNLKSFTPHRSPLGLVFDADNALADPYSGDAFMLGFQRRGDSTGFSTDGKPGTLIDSCEDLLHAELNFTDSAYTMHCTRIVEGFSHPVDACLEGNIIYVIENSVNDSANIWRITMPLAVDILPVENRRDALFATIFPNPVHEAFTLNVHSPQSDHVNIKAFDLQGTQAADVGTYSLKRGKNFLSLNVSSLPRGYYILWLQGQNESVVTTFVKE